MLRMARIVVAVGLCSAIGLHWFLLQSVAWGSMIVKYSQEGSITEAVAKTFDGNHPCGLCNNIRKAQRSERKNETAPVSFKPDLICTTRAILLLPRSTNVDFPSIQSEFADPGDSPPAPPPRSSAIS